MSRDLLIAVARALLLAAATVCTGVWIGRGVAWELSFPAGIGAWLGGAPAVLMLPTVGLALFQTRLLVTLPVVLGSTWGVALCAGATGIGVWAMAASIANAAVTAVAAAMLLGPARGHEMPPGTCRGCGYDLTGLSGPVCPECGLAVGRPSGPLGGIATQGSAPAGVGLARGAAALAPVPLVLVVVSVVIVAARAVR